MSKVLIQKSVLTSKILTGNRLYSNQENSDSFCVFLQKKESQWYRQDMGNYEGTTRESGSLKGRFVATIRLKQQSKEGVTRTQKKRDLEQVNLYVIVIINQWTQSVGDYLPEKEQRNIYLDLFLHFSLVFSCSFPLAGKARRHKDLYLQPLQVNS